MPKVTLPIIGVTGGIGSGKSHVSRMFSTYSCTITNFDSLAWACYREPKVRTAILNWWGNDVFDGLGAVNRQAIAERVFKDPEELKRLEDLLYPMVRRRAVREAQRFMSYRSDYWKAIVWDCPLLFESGLNRLCDAVVFVKTPLNERLARVKARDGMTDEQFMLRENNQMPADEKEKLADVVLDNTNKAVRTEQVCMVLSRVLGGEFKRWYKKPAVTGNQRAWRK